ncbi:MAG: hypothetical protein HOG20_00455 [Candidatus Marinimicrobia bacterium]|nr:hypothetical protein [Candidatus Neomarinimicrobiota bacterium]MBT3691673.1 hypothetical protein [Candidatus Neomarinimicrobiota bacterium]MBT6736677.1 hypothetical protein [Candidatus Neomarinimicrobiota bacterium]MBT7357766.1 hypothetical protein [Candidatus Neomarinimicrobiota bacterium]
MKSLILSLIFLFGASSYGQSLEINGYVRSYLGVLTNDTNDYSINQNTLDLKLKRTDDNVSFFANPFIYQYPNQDVSLGLREAYMDVYFNTMDLRIGKQQIIWGKADGMFITDIVSPKDLGEFLLRDFDEIRTGITSLKANYYLGDNTVEMVWIPTFTPTIMPNETSIWSRIPEFPLPITIDESQKEIPGRLENSEGFIKFSGMSSLLDYEIMAGVMWDDDPTLHIVPIITVDNPTPTGLRLSPIHHQLTLMGGSFSSELGGLILRGEGAYYMGKQFSALNPEQMNLPTSLLEKDYAHYLIGTDFSIGTTRFSTQFIQRAILDYDDLIVQEELDNTMTFLANRTFLQETLTLQLFGYVGLNNEDALIRPSLTYDLADGFEILAGANIFVKNEESETAGLFGHYDENDMVYVKVKYSF